MYGCGQCHQRMGIGVTKLVQNNDSKQFNPLGSFTRCVKPPGGGKVLRFDTLVFILYGQL